MAKVRVIVELATQPQVAAAGLEMGGVSMAAAPAPALAGLEIDASFAPVPLPKLVRAVEAEAFGLTASLADLQGSDEEAQVVPVVESYIVRGEMDEKAAQKLRQRKEVIGVFADVAIQPTLICPGSPPLGSDADVERLLCASRLRSVGADGRSVLVAIVDTGVNLAYLASRGKTPNFDAARSWVPRPGLVPGDMPVGHGTMCAYDVCIMAPACTILDVAVLASNVSGGSIMDGLLSDAVRAYSHLADIMRAPRRPGETRSLVVNNSWGMFHPSWDFPVGNSGNYSHNPNHPFNRIVGTLEGLGADILFAAGNCGRECPDDRCQRLAGGIYGANSHDKVLCVGGVDITKKRVGYSTQGPGHLARNKPDVCGYTHFAGSGVYAADGGTSAATPVVAGLVAAYRSQNHFQPGNPTLSPEAVRNLLRTTALDLGATGFDFDFGFGVVQGCKLADQWIRLEPSRGICQLIPWLCAKRRVPIDLCKRFPHLCEQTTPWPRRIPGIPEPGRRPIAESGTDGDAYAMLDLGENGERLESLGREELAELVYTLGYLDALDGSPAPAPAPPAGGGGKCGCG
ncbi:MAG TPA: S8 family serine peptidase [Allosphingosinicella sp.]|nr:S8 family serine peptidase [Allosphingosinicella sp.]